MENMNDFGGVNTDGLNGDTFGVSSSSMNERNEDVNIYTTSWSGEGSYTVPGYSGMSPEPMQKEGQALEITALVFGILGIVLCCCGGFFGFIGLILSIVALAKGRKNGKSIAALVCSIVALLAAAIMFVGFATDEEFQEAFWEGFEEGYEMSSGEDIDISGDEEMNADESDSSGFNSSVESKEGDIIISSAEASKIVIEGNTFTLPCTLADILKYYEVSAYSEEDMKGGMEPYDTKIIYLAKDGVENGIYVSMYNNEDKKIEDINNAVVDSINIESYSEGAVKSVDICRGIAFGMNAAQVEKALEGCTYNKSENSGYYFYYITAGDKEEYSFSVMLAEDEVVSINVYYYKK